nr:hypothetical protein [Mesorhizobium ciceri]
MEKAERPKARNLQSIFEDLRALAQGDGALHDISVIMYRDWVVAIDLQEGKVADDPEKRWSTTKLEQQRVYALARVDGPVAVGSHVLRCRS